MDLNFSWFPKVPGELNLTHHPPKLGPGIIVISKSLKSGSIKRKESSAHGNHNSTATTIPHSLSDGASGIQLFSLTGLMSEAPEIATSSVLPGRIRSRSEGSDCHGERSRSQLLLATRGCAYEKASFEEWLRRNGIGDVSTFWRVHRTTKTNSRTESRGMVGHGERAVDVRNVNCRCVREKHGTV